MQGKGLSGSYKFTRGPCIYSTSMVAVEVTLVNNSEAPISNICVGEKVSDLEIEHSLDVRFSSFST